MSILAVIVVILAGWLLAGVLLAAGFSFGFRTGFAAGVDAVARASHRRYGLRSEPMGLTTEIRRR